MKLKTLLFAFLLALPLCAGAQEAVIRKNLAERMQGLEKLDEIRPTPMAGLYAVRVGTGVGTNLYYTDSQGDYLIQGSLLDTRAKKNLTQERLDKLTAIKFDELDAKNAFAVVRGNGQRKMAIFEDPNCGYCRHLEQDLQKVDNVTIQVFLIPILGPDSMVKSRQIWCSSDPAKTWIDWMVHNTPPSGNPICNTDAINANLAFARKYRINGTPAIIFADGTRVPGAIDAQQVEQRLSR
jgi:thiol:disulfide interchange protein DsbC